MNSTKKRAGYKLGVNRTEPAHRWRKTAKNFKRSRDEREDRSTRERKMVPPMSTLPAYELHPLKERRKKYG